MPARAEKSPWRLEWNEEWSVCLPEIDAANRHFIRLVNALNKAIIDRKELPVLRERMQALLDDADARFAREEMLFVKWGYPGVEEHTHKHTEIRRALGKIMEHFEHGGLEYRWIEAGLRVRQLLVDHLLTDDMKCRDFCCLSGSTRIAGLRCKDCPNGGGRPQTLS